MNKITDAIYNLLKENNIDNNDMLNTLSVVYRNLESKLWENITVSPAMFYALKDTIWYNLEHLKNGGESLGVSTLRYLGKEFPNLIYACNDSDIIMNSDINGILEELNILISNWNSDWKFVNLFTKSSEGWKGGSEASVVIIYDSNKESYHKYGYNSTYGSILDKNGKTINKFDIDTVLCGVQGPIGEYANGNILYNLVLLFRETCKKALINGKDIKVNFDH